jgi:hypothetical protein
VRRGGEAVSISKEGHSARGSVAVKEYLPKLRKQLELQYIFMDLGIKRKHDGEIEKQTKTATTKRERKGQRMET